MSRWPPGLVDVFRRVSSPSAFSMPTWLLSAIPLFLTPLLNDQASYGGGLFAWFLVGAFGWLCAGFVLLIGGLALRHWRPTSVVIAFFAAAGAVRGLGTSAAITWLGLASTQSVSARVVSGAILGTSTLIVSTLIVDGFRTHRSSVTLMRQEFVLESARLVRADHAFNEVRRWARVEILAEVGVVVRRLESAVHSTQLSKADVSELAGQLHETVERLVRPSSHELAEGSEVSARENPLPPTTSVAVRTLLIDAVTVSPFNAAWLFFFLVPTMLVTGIEDYGIAWGIGGVIASGLCAAGILVVARRFITPRLSAIPVVARAMVCIGVWITAAFAAAIPVAYGLRIDVGPSNAWQVNAIPLLGYVPTACLAIAVAYALVRNWSREERQLEVDLADVRMARLRKEREGWAERRRLSRLLHGDVQAALTSSALRLDQQVLSFAGNTECEPLRDAVRNEVDVLRRALLRVEEEIERPSRAIELTDALASLVRLWERVAVIDLVVTSDAMEFLKRDQVARESAVEIAREATSNAIRHGGADHVRVTLAMHSGAVELHVTDNGRLRQPVTPGIGLQLMGQLSLGLELAPSRSGGTVLHCRIP